MTDRKTITDLEIERLDAWEKFRETGTFDDRERWVEAEHRIIDEFERETGHYRRGPESLRE